jgi:CheY-like chemotaxis protein
VSRSAPGSLCERRGVAPFLSLDTGAIRLHLPPPALAGVPPRRRGTGPLGGDGQRPGEQQVPGPHQPALTGPILVVDDDPAILDAVREILDLEGYPVVTAANGAEALRRVEETRPALMLLDMRMPVLNGWEVARALRERDLALPILVMTAARDAREWAEQIGAAGYLAKPFDLDDLLDAVERLLRAG